MSGQATPKLTRCFACAQLAQLVQGGKACNCRHLTMVCHAGDGSLKVQLVTSMGQCPPVTLLRMSQASGSITLVLRQVSYAHLSISSG